MALQARSSCVILPILSFNEEPFCNAFKLLMVKHSSADLDVVPSCLKTVGGHK